MTVGFAGVMVFVLWLSGRFLPGRQLDPEVEIRPEKTYTIVLWDFDRPLPNGASYREELLCEIQAFNQQFPNIKADVKLFPWDQSEQVVAAIRSRQDIPDVLSYGPIEDLNFGCDMLLPGRYFSKETFQEYVPLAVDGIGVEQNPAVLPRHLAPQLYLVNNDLIQAAGVKLEKLQQRGLGWDDILKLGQKMAQLPGQPFVLASFDYQGLQVAVAPREISTTSSWPQKAAAVAAARLKQLQDQGFLPQNIDQEDYSGIRDFFSGQAALLAPAEPWLVRAVEDRCDRIERGLLQPTDGKPFKVSLVPPKLTSTCGLPARVEKVVVFRQHRADDEIRAAVELAKHLSQSGSLPAKLDLLPAYRPSQDVWCETWKLGNEAVLLGICEHNRRIDPYPNAKLEGKSTVSRIR